MTSAAVKLASIPAATLSCVCNQTKISIASAPIRRVECCCMDCRKGVAWCHTAKGGPEPPHPFLVADLVYFPNLLKVECGREYLKAYLIQQNYNTRRVVATCCWTVLLGDHPAYQQERFVTYPPPAVLSLASGVQLFPPTRRIFTQDLTPEELESLPPLTDTTASSPFPPSPDLKDLQSKFPDYETAQSLIDSFNPILYMDSNYQGKPTAWNQQFPSGPYH